MCNGLLIQDGDREQNRFYSAVAGRDTLIVYNLFDKRKPVIKISGLDKTSNPLFVDDNRLFIFNNDKTYVINIETIAGIGYNIKPASYYIYPNKNGFFCCFNEKYNGDAGYTRAYSFISTDNEIQLANNVKVREEIGSSPDSTIKVFFHNGNGTYILFYKKGVNWDTLTIADGSASISACTIRAIQIDGKGLDEVVISWTNEMSHSYGGYPGGGFFNKYTIHEIWNPDTRKKIFSSQSDYYNQEINGVPVNDSVAITQTVTCSYSYKFAVTAKGQVLISNVKKNNSVRYDDDTTNKIKKERNACSSIKPDHKEGVYILKDGAFVWTKHKLKHQ